MKIFPLLRRNLRLALAFALLWMVLGFGFAEQARAESLTVYLDRSAWFWDSAEGVTACTDDPVKGGCGDISPSKGVFGDAAGTTPISHGHIGVSVRDGGSDMRSYIAFDIPSDSPFFGSEVTKFEVTLIATDPTDAEHTQKHEEATARPPATLNSTAAVIDACLMRDSFGAAEGDPPAQTVVVRPHPESGDNTAEIYTVQKEFTADMSMCAHGKVAPDKKTWTFDIARIAQGWASYDPIEGTGYINNGVGLVPILNGIAANWTVEFHASELTEESINPVTGQTMTNTFVTKDDAARAVIEFTPGVAPPPPPPPPTVQFPSFGNTGPTFVPPQVTPPPPSAPVIGQTPSVPVAFFGPTPWWFYLVLLFGLAGIWFVSGAIIGTDPLAGSKPISVSSRVARVLHARRINGGTGVKPD